VWGNVAYVDAHYADFDFIGGSFSGNTPPNVPRVVANAGTSYRLPRFGGGSWPDRPHVGDSYNTDATP